jgi:putative transcriptional regulator
MELYSGVRDFGNAGTDLAGSLLVAHPNLLDPNFRRAVLFLSAHDPDDGSFGFVLNRATGKRVADFIPEATAGALSDVPVFDGGPVGRDRLTLASFQWKPDEESYQTQASLDLEEAQEIATLYPDSLRAFVGYAGWAQGQLESELAQNSWIVRKAQAESLQSTGSERIWHDIVRELGPWFRLLAAAPDDPSQN